MTVPGQSAVRYTPFDVAKALKQHPPTTEQATVIAAPLGPALVVAGAGSGKTETMAARVVYLVANRIVRPEQILGLTFTRKAAGQLADRIRTRLRALAVSALAEPDLVEALAGAEPEVSTYHAFGGRLIAEFGPLVGIDASARVLTPTASWQLARRVVGRWDGDLETDLAPDTVTERLLAISGSLADHLTDTTALGDEITGVIDRLVTAPPSPRQRNPLNAKLSDHVRKLTDRRWILPLVDAFAAAKRDSGAVDFADQMQLAAQLVRSHPAIGATMRDRYRVVLLDEYQDTGHSQREILRAVFAAAGALGHPVTAVGDPVQSIYSWRGASSSNLPRFRTDFPLPDGSPSPRHTLLTSFRNPAAVLDLANTVSSEVRHDVPGLSARPGAPEGEVRYGLFDTVLDEDEWLADRIAEQWFPPGEENDPREPPTTAVLLRRRRDMASIATALRARNIPVEVVGLGGLLEEPEISDLVAVLRVLVDPNAGAAALRILTGARWQIGTADLEALSRRARELGAARQPGEAETDAKAAVRRALGEAGSGDEGGSASLVDALADLGAPEGYSPEGHRRLVRLSGELHRLRARLGQPLTDLVADVERTIGLDVEVALSGPEGRAHLDAFGEVVAEVAATGAGLPELLDYLATAQEREDGLPPGELETVTGRVQILTVHAAKGLEWEIVAVPHLSDKVFPAPSQGTWLGDAAQLPPAIRGDSDDIPSLDLPREGDQKAMAEAVDEHVGAIKHWQDQEERRLLYVALTRAERMLLVSAHHWGATGVTVRGPGRFLDELAASLAPSLSPDAWAEPPAPDAGNPLTITPRSAHWPVDPLAGRRAGVRAGADLVLAAIAGTGTNGDLAADEAADGDDPLGWARDVTALLAERAAAAAPVLEIDVPGTVSVSALVDLASDPQALARSYRRPMPMPPAPQARRGTAFHQWLEHRFGGEALLEVDQLPGADERDTLAESQLELLTEAFLASEWAARTPVEIEVPFATTIGGLGIRGRIDAVFADPDGGFTVVDWKTGRPPPPDRQAAVAVQLAAYRLAWSTLSGVPLALVRGAFHYVADRLTVRPADLLDEEQLAALIASSTTPADAHQASTAALVHTGPVVPDPSTPVTSVP